MVSSKRLMLLVPATGAAGFTAIAQEAAKQKVPADQAVPSLMFFTLGAVLLVAIVSLVMFLRNRSNRKPPSVAWTSRVKAGF